ncbi:hypothetical protein [Nocardia acidivorans]|nr:hypothetical protein [Nocardia acidivorans]
MTDHAVAVRERPRTAQALWRNAIDATDAKGEAVPVYQVLRGRA